MIIIVKCEICGKEFEKFRGLACHIGWKHKNEITREEYYLKFIGEKGKCVDCEKDTTFIGLIDGYNKFCSKKCSNNSLEVKNKKKESCFENSGYENPMQNPENQEKSRKTYMKKQDINIHLRILKLKKRKTNLFRKIRI